MRERKKNAGKLSVVGVLLILIAFLAVFSPAVFPEIKTLEIPISLVALVVGIIGAGLLLRNIDHI